MSSENNYLRKARFVKDFLKEHRNEIISIMVSFIVISVWTNIRFTLFVFLVLAIHEGGHGWALIKRNVGIKRVYFFIIGGGVMPKREFRCHDEAVYVAIMGSVFTMILIMILSIAWYVFDIALIAEMIIFLSAITVFNLLPYVFLDGGHIRDSFLESNKVTGLSFIIPELAIAAFLMFKSSIVTPILILLLINLWAKRKMLGLKEQMREQNMESETIPVLTNKEMRLYYVTYIFIVLLCIIVSFAFEFNGYRLDIAYNFDNIINKI